MFDKKNSDEKQILCGCGSITEEQADALVKEVHDMNGIPDYFVNGVAAGLYFACLESGDMRGTTIEEFVRNAHDAYIDEAATQLVDEIASRKIFSMGGVMKVEVRHA